ncbi:MAG: CoA transferase [Gammaproteobacteria bacterium]|nr:CoA transferase [Gammaproteobacteria bacterium]
MGPLSGKRIIEIKGIGPGPYAGMVLADLGAQVLVVERASSPNPSGIPTAIDLCSRGKKSIALDLKNPEGVNTLLKLVESADAILEGFRPGVVEKLGIGPEQCMQRNPKIVYGRITGWGQEGPLSQSAGHDLNYIALTGAANAIGTHAQPTPPLNIIGDYAAGSLFLVVGMLSAMIEASDSGKGQVVDSAITDGSAHLMSMFYSLTKAGAWGVGRQRNLLDGGAPFYRAYRTSDNKFIAVAPIEPHFFAEMVKLAGLSSDYIKMQNNPKHWPQMHEDFAKHFASKTRDEWAEIFEGSDACVTSMLDYQEALAHDHNIARQTYVDVDGDTQPAPAPRFSRTKAEVAHGAHTEGADTHQALQDWGIDANELERLDKLGVLT